MSNRPSYRYCKRVWLNPSDCNATGSVVAFDGTVEWRKGQIVEETSVEVADCSGKVSLHKSPSEDMSRFIQKLRLLARTVNDFADFLEGRCGT